MIAFKNFLTLFECAQSQITLALLTGEEESACLVYDVHHSTWPASDHENRDDRRNVFTTILRTVNA